MIEILEPRLAPSSFASIDLAGLNGQNGFRIEGTVKNQRLAAEIVPDLNGDGLDEFLILNGRPPRDDRPMAYLVYGRAEPYPRNFDVTKLTPNQGVEIFVPFPSRGSPLNAGRSLLVADINGDGFDDIVGRNTERIVARFGTGTGFDGPIDLGEFAPSEGVSILFDGGPQRGTLSNLGDVNGDGIDDLGLSNPDQFNVTQHWANVIFGSREFAGEVAIGPLNGVNGFTISGYSADVELALWKAETAGDVNGDGTSDMILTGATVGAPVGSYEGYIIYGSKEPFAAQLNLNALTRDQGVRFHDSNGNLYEASRVGDINDDGFADFASAGRSAVTIVYGNGELPLEIDIAALRPDQCFRYEKLDVSDIVHVSGLGDWNRDGFRDIAFFTASYSTSTDVVLGGVDRPAVLSGRDLDGENGFKIWGHGQLADALGDTNGDGRPELAFSNRGVPDDLHSGRISVYTGPTVEFSANGKTAKYSDPDGDLVKVKTSAGAFTHPQFAFSNTGVLESLKVTGPDFTGANITVSVKRSAVGDGHTAIGFLDASGVDLGVVSLLGDLGRISAGDADYETAGIETLKVTTFGRFGVSTQSSADQSLISVIAGDISRITVQKDIVGVEIAALRIDSMFVGGSVCGTEVAPVRISGTGVVGEPTIALGNIRVIDDVIWAEFLGGYGASRTPVSGLGRIDSINVGGNWQASSVSAGVLPGPGGYFGAVENVFIADYRYTGFNGINSLRIGGFAEGTVAEYDHFGIVAPRIGRIQIAGRLLVDDISPVGNTDDILIRR